MEKRGFKFYWDLMDAPVIISAIYFLINLVFPLADFIGSIASSILFLLVLVFVFGFAGYRVSKEKDVSYARTGAYAGVIIGLISAVIGILTYYLFPGRFAASIQSAVQAGASASMVETFIKIGIFSGIVINPAIYAGIGALITWISGFIFKKKKK